ncbi:polysaccharide deacetylase family protein [Sedimentibacter sp. MB31-C6]|uniref:polysaccharide deacetylase family protein n=1 Tax=Sedimentibacter sp. MB31-C6 TaxID=3109366 RepID=UPI002DDCD312|nr:polysaccharide deacetylase family protein [Sedimentibacter sp. MB36-C1]WSI03954.1 polysaccharide deacetylase family protein [Sedimentibacter sp. MB36-C1]
MHGYRLTKRGKIVLTMFIILFSIISTYSLRPIVIASDNDNLNNKSSIETNHTIKSNIYYSTKDIKANIDDMRIIKMPKVDFNINQIHEDTSKNNNEEKFLSIPIDKVTDYKERKIAFLTFDDGPSKNVTPLILDILDEYNIKATFFVLGVLCDKNGNILKDIVSRGNSIGIHSYSHNYKKLFANKEEFKNELILTENILKEILGEEYKTRLFRFPGGSFEDYKSKYKDILYEEGYISIDWNVITGDGERINLLPEEQLKILKATIKGKNHVILLLHDSATKQTTVEALPSIIDYLKSQEYEFAILE